MARIRLGAPWLAALGVAVAVAAWAAWPEATTPAPADGAPESNRRMAERLRELADRFERRSARGTGRFFAANAPGSIPRLRQRLARPGDPGRAANLRFRLAQELLFDGRSDEARVALGELWQSLGAGAAGDAETRQLVRRWLVLANLRLAEQRNCAARHGPDSCLFPIEAGGVHADPRGSRRAVMLLREALAERPDDLEARWLLNVAAMTLGEHPDGVPPRWRIPPEAFAAEHDVKRFLDVSEAAGVDVFGLAGGAILEDFDGDGRLDVVASSWGVRDALRYLHNEGDGRFADHTQRAGLAGQTGGLNLSHADYDNDGRPDILVLRGGWLGAEGGLPHSLLRNEGGGRFRDVTEEAGLLTAAPGQTAAWADFDADGLLDLFLGYESTGPAAQYPCQLLRNRGDGSFVDWAPALGLAELGFVKGAAWGDYDDDGRPDLYVSRMSQPNLLFRNEGPPAEPGPAPWRFREVSAEAGVREPRMSFPTWFFDYDNDGRLDLFVAGWDGSGVGAVAASYLGMSGQGARPRLYRNRGDGRFEEVAAALGLDRVLLAMGANFGDLDNDGWLDVYLGTGAPDFAVLMPNRMFRNARGRRFQDVTTSGGFGHLQKGHGIAFGDVDGDGDQDIYAVMGGWYTGDGFPNALFENPGHGNAWVTLRLEGVRSNRSAIGARIRVTVRDDSGVRHIHRRVGTGGSFGSSSLQQEIGLGSARAIEELEVRWPTSGTRQVFRDVPLRRVLVIREDAHAPRVLAQPPLSGRTSSSASPLVPDLRPNDLPVFRTPAAPSRAP